MPKRSSGNRPAPNGQFATIPRAVLESDAYRGAGINTRRALDVVLLEDQRHAGKDNGRLGIPRRYFEAYGIPRAYVSDALKDGIHRRLFSTDRKIGTHGDTRLMRFEITFLAKWDGTPPSDAWRTYRPGPDEKRLPDYPPKKEPRKLPHKGASISYRSTPETAEALTHKGEVALTHKGEVVGTKLPHKGASDTAKLTHIRVVHKCEPLSREGAIAAASTAAPAVASTPPPLPGTCTTSLPDSYGGWAPCGMPAVSGTDRCTAHTSGSSPLRQRARTMRI